MKEMKKMISRKKILLRTKEYPKPKSDSANNNNSSIKPNDQGSKVPGNLDPRALGTTPPSATATADNFNNNHNQLPYDDFMDENTWFNVEQLFEDQINEIQKKWGQIDDEIWAKIVCFERNRRIAKAYSRSQVISVCGSEVGFDGYRIGLNGFANFRRDTETELLKQQIKTGFKLKIDEIGNIFIKRVGKCNVYISGGAGLIDGSSIAGSRQSSVAPPSSSSTTLSSSANKLSENGSSSSSSSSEESGCCSGCSSGSSSNSSRTSNGSSDLIAKTSQFSANASDDVPKSSSFIQLEFNKPVTIFDIRNFQQKIHREFLQQSKEFGHQLLGSSKNGPISTEKKLTNLRKLEHQCIHCIQLVEKQEPDHSESDLLRHPCWIVLINIVALDLLRSRFGFSHGSNGFKNLWQMNGMSLQSPSSFPMLPTNGYDLGQRAHPRHNGHNHTSNYPPREEDNYGFCGVIGGNGNYRPSNHRVMANADHHNHNHSHSLSHSQNHRQTPQQTRFGHKNKKKTNNNNNKIHNENSSNDDQLYYCGYAAKVSNSKKTNSSDDLDDDDDDDDDGDADLDQDGDDEGVADDEHLTKFDQPKPLVTTNRRFRNRQSPSLIPALSTISYNFKNENSAKLEIGNGVTQNRFHKSKNSQRSSSSRIGRYSKSSSGQAPPSAVSQRHYQSNSNGHHHPNHRLSQSSPGQLLQSRRLFHSSHQLSMESSDGSAEESCSATTASSTSESIGNFDIDNRFHSPNRNHHRDQLMLARQHVPNCCCHHQLLHNFHHSYHLHNNNTKFIQKRWRNLQQHNQLNHTSNHHHYQTQNSRNQLTRLKKIFHSNLELRSGDFNNDYNDDDEEEYGDENHDNDVDKNNLGNRTELEKKANLAKKTTTTEQLGLNSDKSKKKTMKKKKINKQTEKVNKQNNDADNYKSS